MNFEWPKDLERHVLGLVDSDRRRGLVQKMIRTITPRERGSSDNPFFTLTTATAVLPIARNRPVEAALPDMLRPFYETYSDAVEFSTDDGLVFMSETEILSRAATLPPGWLDVAFRYAGMGHVEVFTYDKENDLILSDIDGGANGFDRERNARVRREGLSHYRSTGSLAYTHRGASPLRFEEWWERHPSPQRI